MLTCSSFSCCDVRLHLANDCTFGLYTQSFTQMLYSLQSTCCHPSRSCHSNHQNHRVSSNFFLAIIQKLYDFAQSWEKEPHNRRIILLVVGEMCRIIQCFCMIFLDLPRAPLHDIHDENGLFKSNRHFSCAHDRSLCPTVAPLST